MWICQTLIECEQMSEKRKNVNQMISQRCNNYQCKCEYYDSIPILCFLFELFLLPLRLWDDTFYQGNGTSSSWISACRAFHVAISIFFPSAEIIFPTDGIVAVFAYESTPLIFFTGKFSTFCPLSYSRFKCQFRFEHLLKHIFIDKSPLWEYVSLSFKIHALKFPYASKNSMIISSHNAQNSNYLYFSKAIKKFVDFLLNSS